MIDILLILLILIIYIGLTSVEERLEGLYIIMKFWHDHLVDESRGYKPDE